MVDICTLCRCLDAKTSNEMIVDCHGEDQQAAAGGQHAKYFNLQNIIWPVPKDPLNNPLRIRAFFRNMKLPTLPRPPSSAYVTELHFSNNAIDSYYNEPFENFKNLESLIMTGNDLKAMDKDFFASQNVLKHLDLSNNSLSTVNALERAFLEHLESINLSHNKLMSISELLMGKLRNASIVRLEHCELYSWMSYDELAWKELYLGWNKLKGLHVAMFFSMPKLEILDLSHNQIYALDPQAFASLSQLRRLDLSFNEISNMFANIKLPSALNSISIAGNSIGQWPFADLPESLELLEIQNNRLTDLHLAQTVNVLILNASDNELDVFNGDSFPKLTTLDLSYNKFSELPRKLGKNLLGLILDGNPFERIFFDEHVSLKFLSLSRLPNLKELGEYSFWRLVGREDDKEQDCVEIRMSHCPKLQSISSMAFENVELCKLDISYNKLTSIPVNLTDWESLSGEVNLQGNPWNCSCSEQWLVDEMLPMLYENKDLQYLLDDFRCASPVARHNVRLIKFLNHRGAFCGGPQLARLVDGTQSQDSTVKAGFSSIICSVDDEACWHVHKGSGMIAFCIMMAATLLVSIALLIFIIVRRRKENRQKNTFENIWLIRNKQSTVL
ncbi:AAEL005739-PA, partial [Aedes aegypti]